MHAPTPDHLPGPAPASCRWPLLVRRSARRSAKPLARLLAHTLTPLLAAVIGVAQASPERSSALLAEHASVQASVQASVFGEPLLLRSSPQAGAARQGSTSGEVLAVLPRPLTQVVAPFRSAAGLCSLLILHLNVRDCQPLPGPGEQVQIAAGPMRESLPGMVYKLQLRLQPEADGPAYFSASLGAAEGPLGSSDLWVKLEAVALAAGQTYVHLVFSQTNGLAARMATRLYLSTAGRHKIGFSSDGLDALGQPRPVSGERAALERNVMRHYLALLAHSGVLSGTPAARLDARLRAWHALTERHAAQLHELDLADYLAEKQGAAAAAAR